MTLPKRGLLLGWIGCLPALACSPGAVSRVVEPDATTANTALGEDRGTTTCRAVGQRDQPLVVDWKAHERSNLEVAMKQGVAVVRYDCDGMRLLPDCTLDGSYRYLGTSKKEQVVKLDTADEIAVNLPTLGRALAGDFSATLARGSTLELAMVLVGKWRTTVDAASADTLPKGPGCTGATHFVRGAFVGAFVMGTGTRGELSSVASVVAASSRSSTLRSYRDGDPAACSGDADGPQANCRGLLRVELVALGEKPVQIAPGMDSSAFSCPNGLVLSGGKCTIPGIRGEAYTCTGRDPLDCLEQCDRGDLGSCTLLAGLYLIGYGVAKNPKLAIPLFERACQGGFPKACGGLGYAYQNGLGVASDPPRAAAYYQRACDAGNAEACSNLGVAFGDAKGVAHDEQHAGALFRRACDGGEAVACFNLGVLTQYGRGRAADPAQALALYVNACNGRVSNACFRAGLMTAAGDGTAASPERAKSFFMRGCDAGNRDSCEELEPSPKSDPPAPEEAAP